MSPDTALHLFPACIQKKRHSVPYSCSYRQDHRGADGISGEDIGHRRQEQTVGQVNLIRGSVDLRQELSRPLIFFPDPDADGPDQKNAHDIGYEFQKILIDQENPPGIIAVRQQRARQDAQTEHRAGPGSDPPYALRHSVVMSPGVYAQRPEDQIRQKNPVGIGKGKTELSEKIGKSQRRHRQKQGNTQRHKKRHTQRQPHPQRHQKVKLHDDDDIIELTRQAAPENACGQLREGSLHVTGRVKTQIIDCRPDHVRKIDVPDTLPYVTQINSRGDLSVSEKQSHFYRAGEQKGGHHKTGQPPGKIDYRRLPRLRTIPPPMP